jgi:hypothetical protein
VKISFIPDATVMARAATVAVKMDLILPSPVRFGVRPSPPMTGPYERPGSADVLAVTKMRFGDVS